MPISFLCCKLIFIK